MLGQSCIGQLAICEPLTSSSTPLDESLYNSPAEILQTLLYQQGLSGSPFLRSNWPTYAYRMPNSPDNCVLCLDQPNFVQGATNTDNEAQEHYGVQLRVRAATPDVCYSEINQLLTNLDEGVAYVTVVIDTHVYLVQTISRDGGIEDYGNEVAASRRAVMGVNLSMSVVQLN